MNLLETIHELPDIEKIKIMEFLWEELTLDDKNYLSPQWHQEELKKTEQRFSDGKEELIDWKTAKQLLRNEFE